MGSDVQASFMDGFNAVYKYLLPKSFDLRNLLRRFESRLLMRRTLLRAPHEVRRLPFSPSVAGFCSEPGALMGGGKGIRQG